MMAILMVEQMVDLKAELKVELKELTKVDLMVQ
jgi:hypothetical protein